MLPTILTSRKVASMKTVPLMDVPARREELLDALAQGETFAVTDGEREVAMLTPLQSASVSNGGGNAFDLIADLIGTADGPRDLSSKKRHLTGFGLDGTARRGGNGQPRPE